MSDMESRKGGGRRPRRQFSEEFKAQTVRLVLDEGKPVGAVARGQDPPDLVRPGHEQRSECRRMAQQTPSNTRVTVRLSVASILLLTAVRQRQ
jgi:transposase-like protein